MHRKEKVLAQRIHTFFLKTNNSVKLHEKQSFLVNSLFVLVEELTRQKRCQTEGAQKGASSWANVAAIFLEKTVLSNHTINTPLVDSLFVLAEELTWKRHLSSLDGAWMDTFFLHDFLVGLKSSYLAIHEDFSSEYSLVLRGNHVGWTNLKQLSQEL
jgi:hypothetical protein